MSASYTPELPLSACLSTGNRAMVFSRKVEQRKMLLGKPLIDTLDRVGCGGLVLTGTGEVLIMNETAHRMLRERYTPNGDEAGVWARAAVKLLLTSAGSERIRMAEEAWVLVPPTNGGLRQIAVHAIPCAQSPDQVAQSVLVLIDLNDTSCPRSETLRKLFKLTPAEAKLAIEICHGKALEKIAAEIGVAIGTARKHLASIFTKTATTRQAELVALLSRVAMLP